MLKILQARPQQYVNRERPDVQAGLEKAQEHMYACGGFILIFGKTLLAFALLHSVFQGQICLLLQVFLEKAEEPEIKLPTSTGSSKKQEGSTKTSMSALLTMPKPLTVWITINCGKF